MLFIDASREFGEEKNQNRLREDIEVEKIVKTYLKRKTVDKYAYVASKDELQENDYNLNIPRYVDTFVEEEEIDIDQVQQEISHLESELVATRKQMQVCLKELGYGQ